jgi:two-component system chemotaxis response regulator CheB
MAKIRVLVVEDSLTVRKHLTATLSADPDIEVVGEAEDGRRAIELCQQHRPAVISMDMMLPVMTGLAATEYIMAYCPTPILIVSSSLNRGEMFRTYDALAAGAVDVIDKMSGDEPDGLWERNFISMIKLVAKIRVITHPRARLSAFGGVAGVAETPSPTAGVAAAGRGRELAVMGASTGGPGAFVEVLRGLPRAFQRPLLLVLHINEPFGSAFADWLDGQTERRVSLAKDGEAVASTAGRVVMAPPGYHLVVKNRRLRLTSEPERHSCRPSIDTLFESVADEYGATASAALLTGMGRDGAAGLLEIRKAGGHTIAQDEATSVIYGMPREAVLMGAAEQVLPLGQIASALAAGGQEPRR